MEPSKMTGKVAGMAKSMGKALQGYSGIFRQLAEEHGQVAAMLKRVQSEKEPQERRHLFARVRRELLSHARAEEQEFYSRLRERPETRGLVQHSLEEHRRVEEMVEWMHRSDPGTEEWSSSASRLAEAVQEHVKEEENQLFPEAKHLVSSQDAVLMKERYLSAKEAESAKLLY